MKLKFMKDWGIFPSFLCIFSLHIEDNVQVRLGGGLERKRRKYVVSFSRIFFFHKSHLWLILWNFFKMTIAFVIDEWANPTWKKSWFRMLAYLLDLRRLVMWIKVDLTLKSSFSKGSFLFESWHILCTLDPGYKMKNYSNLKTWT